MTHYTLVSELKRADFLVMPLFEGGLISAIKAFDVSMLPHVTKAIERDFEGKKGQTMLLYGGVKYPRLLFIGLGEKKTLSLETWKRVVGAAVIAAQEKKTKTMTMIIPAEVLSMIEARAVAEYSVIAAEMADYAFDEYKQKKERVLPLSAVHFLLGLSAAQRRSFEKGLAEGLAIADGVNFVRRLGDTPPSIMTPSLLAEHAVEMCRGNRALRAKILSRPEMKGHGMGCLLGVSSGSAKDPKFIIVEYRGASRQVPGTLHNPTVLVGKGITFDSGGLHIKPEQYLSDMKFDMLGAATVLGVVKIAAALGLKKNIVVLVPACENMPDGDSYRPDDILVAMNGKSVEIVNTDAEGRVILADALSYAAMKYKPKEVIDFATLTGACMVAVGLERSGLFSPDERTAESILAASRKSAESLWRLPLGEEFGEEMKSDVADIKNLSANRYGGASSGAAFLQYFTLDSKNGAVQDPWAHIDMSSAYIKGKGKPWIRGGANGFGVQTMVEYLR